MLMLSGCALLRSVGLGGVADTTEDLGSTAGAIAARGAQAADIKKRWDECQLFSVKAVALPEEYSIGGAIAVGMANKMNSPVFIEISPEIKDLSAAQLKPFANKTVSTATGPKTNLHRYVAELGKRLASASSRPTLPWTFVILENDASNAFSAPGGYVFVTTGLFKSVTNEAQLAGVLAHEIGHVVEKHALKPYQRAKANACVSAKMNRNDLTVLYGIPIVGDLARTTNDTMRDISYAGEVTAMVSAGKFDPNALSEKFLNDVVNDAVQFVGNGFDASDELAADTIASELMIFNNYDTLEYEKILTALPEGGWFSPHPKNEARIAAVAKARSESAPFAATGKAPALSKSVTEALK
jgi:beta-barrel assembly-enhancing protease